MSSKDTANNGLAASSSLRALKWATIVLPLAFLVVFSYVGHFFLSSFIRSVPGFFALTAVLAVTVFLFSHGVFKLIQRAENRALSRHQELLTLNTVAAAASQPMKLRELLQIAVDGVTEAIGVDGILACVLDEKNQELHHVAYRNIPEEVLGPLRKVKLEEGRIDTTVVRTGEPMYVKDLSQDPRFKATGRKPHFNSVLTVPLKSEGKVKGVMALVSHSPFVLEPSQVQFLLTIGGQLAVAIERTQLQQQVVSTAVLEERERIAREMHDGMAQLLGYINTQTIAVNKFISDRELAQAQEELAKMQDITHDLYADVREGILALRMETHQQKGVIAALGEYVERFMEMSSVRVEMQVSPDVAHPTLEPSTEIQLMRIVQEALTNVRKHSRATTAVLAFKSNENHLQVTIVDDGQGFELTHLPTTGWPRFGLQTMRERAEAVGGTLQIDTAPGQGTMVLLSVPMSRGEN